MFKVGDRVVIVVSHFYIPAETIGTITRLDIEIMGCDVNPDDMEEKYFFFFNEIRLATPLDEVLE